MKKNKKVEIKNRLNKEIKIILPVIKKKKIRSNIELIELIGSDRYTEIESRLKYYD